jgi:hypothetical protein
VSVFENDLEQTRTEVVGEITRAMLLASGDVLLKYGNDPMSEPILAAALATFIDQIERKVSPGFKGRFIKLLQS